MSPVSQAVLLAAGRGTRLGSLTDNFPKAMIDVGGMPILHRIIGGLARVGVSDIIVTTGHFAEVIEAGTGDGSRWDIRIQYVRQETTDGTARALALARDSLSDESFFVGWADVLVDISNYATILKASEEVGASLAVNDVEDPHNGAAVYVDERSIVTRLVEKPAPGTSTTRWNNAGLCVLVPTIWDFIERLELSPRGEYELPEAIANFVADGNSMVAVPIAGPWFDTGTPENLAAARTHFEGPNTAG